MNLDSYLLQCIQGLIDLLTDKDTYRNASLLNGQQGFELKILESKECEKKP